MSIQIKQILEETRDHYALHLLTGPNGLTREFTWVQLCEDINNIDFFQGSELVITTGLCAMHNDWLRQFILSLIDHHVCGLIINVGKYITEQDIPADVLSLCQEQHFPLITMPWKIHLAAIMQDYCGRLLLAQQQEQTREALFRDILFEHRPREEYHQDLQRHGIEDEPFSLRIFPSDLTDAAQQQSLLLAWKRKLNPLRLTYVLFFLNHQILLLSPARNDTAQTAMLAELMTATPAAKAFHYGTSSIHSDFTELPSAFREAAAAAAVAGLTQQHHLSFEHIGPYRLLFALRDTPLLVKMRDQRLQPLLAYDAQHHTQLTATLRTYLFHSNSLQETAALTFTHRNTINYRIHKVRELTGCKLEDSVTSFDFMLAFYIDDYLHMCSEHNSDR